MQYTIENNLYEIRKQDRSAVAQAPVVFISYKHNPDKLVAEVCARKIAAAGLYSWLDVDRIPQDQEQDDVQIATYIEEGLDESLFGSA